MRNRSFGPRPALLPAVAFKLLLRDWPDAGVYQLRLRLSQNIRVRVGALGRFVFPGGVYVYTGRASRGLKARVLRHVNGGPRKHWHVDYLLASRRVCIDRLILASADPEEECLVNKRTGEGGICVVRGFGASDCRDGCEAHLWLVP